MKTKVYFLATLLVALHLQVSAQDNQNWAFEFNIGPSFATEQPAESDPNTGFGFEGLVSYAFMPHTSAYVGWGWNQFGTSTSVLGNDLDFEETGYVMGAQFIHPIGQSPIALLLRGGAIFNHIEVENTDGDILYDTQHGWGWQVAAGLEIPLQNQWSIRPLVKYHDLNHTIDFEDQQVPMNQSYVSVRVGVAKRF